MFRVSRIRFSRIRVSRIRVFSKRCPGRYSIRFLKSRIRLSRIRLSRIRFFRNRAAYFGLEPFGLAHVIDDVFAVFYLAIRLVVLDELSIAVGNQLTHDAVGLIPAHPPAFLQVCHVDPPVIGLGEDIDQDPQGFSG
ncbi:hypothetical protein DNA98_03770 [Meiothermus sp. Pnk-1]|nr:hypothetical protein DNA98_03770 [Meiothermus sp. Pnk-1]